MKVLVCFESRVRPDSTGVYIVNAFRYLGHSVKHVLPEEMAGITGGYDLYCRIDNGIPDFTWPAYLHPSWWMAIDTHIEWDWRIEMAKRGKFDFVSVTHSQGLDLPWGRDDVFWLPVGCDDQIHHIGQKEKIYDGCFIGNFHNNLAGPRIEMLDVFFKAAPNFFFGSRMFHEMTEKYAQSKLVFNRSISGDVNMRVFEALCSGSCLITDRVPDLERLGFLDKGHYFGYSSKDELKELTEMLLRNPAMRERVASAGRQFVMERHQYKHRVKTLLEKMEVVCNR